MKYQIIPAALTAALLVGCSSGDNDSNTASSAQRDASPAAASSMPAKPAATGGDAVEFALGDMDGTIRLSSEWDTQPKLLNFWATWCAPCRREIPLLKETQDQYGESHDIQVIGIAVDRLEDVVAYAEEAQFNYPILVGEQDAMEVAESSGIDFIGLPFTMVLSASGELIKTHVGEIKEEHIAQIADVIAQMERGELDVAGAREALGAI